MSTWEEAPVLLHVYVAGVKREVASVRIYQTGEPFWGSQYAVDRSPDDPDPRTRRPIRQPLDPTRVNGMWDAGYWAWAPGLGNIRIPVALIQEAIANGATKVVHHP